MCGPKVRGSQRKREAISPLLEICRRLVRLLPRHTVPKLMASASSEMS
jgi:hypothetical protein